MNNCEEFQCPSLDVSIGELKEALRCIIFTILFNRAIGGNRPIDPITIKAPLFEVGYMKTDSREVDALVEEKIKAFTEVAERSLETQILLNVGFFTEVARDAGLLWQVFSSKKTEKIYFERWRVPITVSPRTRPPTATDEETSSRVSGQQVRSIMWFVLKKAGEKTDHLPLTSQTAIYPFDIAFERKGSSAWSPRSIASSIKSIPYIT